MNVQLFRNLGLLAFMLHIATFAYTQDTLYLKSSEVLEVKVLELSEEEIRYKKTSYLEGPTYIIPLYRAIAVKLANGELISFEDKKKEEAVSSEYEQLKPDSVVLSSDAYYQGYQAAADNFGGKGAFWGTYVSTSVMPPLGLFVGTSVSSFKPTAKNMTIPPEFQQNPIFLNGYTKKAKSTKLKQAAKGVGLGTLTFLLVLAALSSS